MPRTNYGLVALTDSAGLPIGVVDSDAIELRAQRMVFELAPLCLDRERLRTELDLKIAALPTEDAALVILAAVRLVYEDLLAPAVELLKATGTDLTIAFAEIAKGLSSNVDDQRE
jgi:hypothetical protein